MKLDLYEFETVEAAAVEAVGGGDAGAGAATEAAVPAAAVEDGTPSPEAPPAPAWSPDDPAFVDAVDQRAADLIDVRLQQMFANQPQAEQAAPAADEVDWNEALNPLSDNYGASLVKLLQQRDQFLLDQMREMNAPVLSRYQQESLQEGQQRIDDIIADDFSRNGAIEVPDEFAGKVDPSKTIKDIAPVFMGQFEQRYGEGSARAAEAALHHAASLIRGVFEAGAKSGEARYTNRMATLTSATGEPAGSGGAIHAGDAAETVDEAIARAFSRGVAA